MATPIKETPILTGKDARRFEKELEAGKPVSKEKIQRAKKAFESIKFSEK